MAPGVEASNDIEDYVDEFLDDLAADIITRGSIQEHDIPAGFTTPGHARLNDAAPYNATSNGRSDHGADDNIVDKVLADVEADLHARGYFERRHAPSGLKTSRHAQLNISEADGLSDHSGTIHIPQDETLDRPDEDDDPDTSNGGDGTDDNGTPGKKKKNRRRTRTAQVKALEARDALRLAALDGKVVNKDGMVVDSQGAIFGHVVEGNASEMLGLKCDKKRDILDNCGQVVGHADLDIAILKGMKAAIRGNIVDTNYVQYGHVMNLTGNPVQVWLDYQCNDKGQLVSPSGEVVDEVRLVDEAELRSTKTSIDNNANLGNKRKRESEGVVVENRAAPGSSSRRHDGNAVQDLKQHGNQREETLPHQNRELLSRKEKQRIRSMKDLERRRILRQQRGVWKRPCNI